MEKRIKHGLRWLAVALAWGLTAQTALAGDAAVISSASLLAEACTGCHGTDGVSAGPAIPVISGLSELYFFDLMQAFQEDQSPSTVMGPIAKGYSEDELRLLAGHFGALPFVAATQPFDPALIEKGAKLHHQYCEKCHIEGGRSRDEDAGILAGQWRTYLVWTLDDFRGGKRPMSRSMGDRLEKLLVREGEAGLEALLHFYASRDQGQGHGR